jgi:hypothetical protein
MIIKNQLREYLKKSSFWLPVEHTSQQGSIEPSLPTFQWTCSTPMQKTGINYWIWNWFRNCCLGRALYQGLGVSTEPGTSTPAWISRKLIINLRLYRGLVSFTCHILGCLKHTMSLLLLMLCNKNKIIAHCIK